MKKIKLFLESEKGKDLLIVVIVILVGLASFELGRLSKNTSSSGLKIENKSLGANSMSSLDENNTTNTQKPFFLSEDATNTEANSNLSLKTKDKNELEGLNTKISIKKNQDILANIENPSENQYFASKRGKKFYSLTCSAGKTIKQENRVYFSSSSMAIKAGYELSESCR